MRGQVTTTCLAALVLFMAGDVLTGSSVAETLAQSQSPSAVCGVTAAGTLAAIANFNQGDRFAGSVVDLGDAVVGHWTHITADGRMLLGSPESLDCAQNGALLVTIIGTARFAGVDDAPFAVLFQDRENPAETDLYRIIVVDPAGNLLYEAIGDLASGDVRTRHSD